MSDVENVKKKIMELELGGETRQLRYGMRAWEEIQKRFKGLTGIGEGMDKDQPGTIIALVDIGLIRKQDEKVTKDQIAEWLDDYDIAEIIDIASRISALIAKGLPTAKEGAGGPQ